MIRLLLFLTLAICHTSTLDYCASSLCTVDGVLQKHIDCNNYGGFGSRCLGRGRTINMSVKNRDQILRLINTRRNRVATGNLAGFETAARMPTVVWNTDLARLASLSCKRCLPTHDACRNTYTFKRVGQTVSYQWKPTGNNINYPKHLTTIFQNWFLQHQNANSDKIASFTKDPPDYSHFATMVNDHITHVGCGSCSWKGSKRNNIVTVCNWASQNAEGKAVYSTGDSASGCTTGTNPNYPGLCKIGEPVDPNTNWP